MPKKKKQFGPSEMHRMTSARYAYYARGGCHIILVSDAEASVKEAVRRFRLDNDCRPLEIEVKRLENPGGWEFRKK